MFILGSLGREIKPQTLTPVNQPFVIVDNKSIQANDRREAIKACQLNAFSACVRKINDILISELAESLRGRKLLSLQCYFDNLTATPPHSLLIVRYPFPT